MNSKSKREPRRAVDLAVLRVLNEIAEPIGIADLAKRTNLAAKVLRPSLNRLYRDEFLTREPTPKGNLWAAVK